MEAGTFATLELEAECPEPFSALMTVREREDGTVMAADPLSQVLLKVDLGKGQLTVVDPRDDWAAGPGRRSTCPTASGPTATLRSARTDPASHPRGSCGSSAGSTGFGGHRLDRTLQPTRRHGREDRFRTRRRLLPHVFLLETKRNTSRRDCHAAVEEDHRLPLRHAPRGCQIHAPVREHHTRRRSMGRGEGLSQLEQYVLLCLVRLDGEAYGVPIHEEIEERLGRSVSIATIYSALDRLEKEGLISSYLSDPLPERGGRAKRLFRLSPDGAVSLHRARRVHEKMWEGVDLRTVLER